MSRANFLFEISTADEAKSGQCATLRPGLSVHSSSMGENVVFQMMKLTEVFQLYRLHLHSEHNVILTIPTHFVP